METIAAAIIFIIEQSSDVLLIYILHMFAVFLEFIQLPLHFDNPLLQLDVLRLDYLFLIHYLLHINGDCLSTATDRPILQENLRETLL